MVNGLWSLGWVMNLFGKVFDEWLDMVVLEWRVCVRRGWCIKIGEMMGYIRWDRRVKGGVVEGGECRDIG